MSILKEFKEFAMRGNVLDLAVGVIIGGAFGKIVNSLVNDLIMPPIGFALKGVNFRDLAIVLQRDPEGNPVASIGYGAFLQNTLEFLIIAFAVFLLVQAINRLRKRYEQGKEHMSSPPPPPSEEVLLLREIRDALYKTEKEAHKES